MSRKGPLADKYWAAVALVILALTPYLVLTSSVSSLNEMIGKSLHLSEAALEMTSGMANAAYCFGTVLAIQLTTRLPGRRLLVGFIVAFIAASVVAAWAPSGGLFIAARVVQGLTTALMLIAAVPPLVIGWPRKRVRPTARRERSSRRSASALAAATSRPSKPSVACGSGSRCRRALPRWSTSPSRSHLGPAHRRSRARRESDVQGRYQPLQGMGADHSLLRGH